MVARVFSRVAGKFDSVRQSREVAQTNFVTTWFVLYLLILFWLLVLRRFYFDLLSLDHES